MNYLLVDFKIKKITSALSRKPIIINIDVSPRMTTNSLKIIKFNFYLVLSEYWGVGSSELAKAPGPLRYR